MSEKQPIRRELPGIWVTLDFEDSPTFFTYLPLSNLWIKPKIIIDKKNDWFLGALDELTENKNAD